MSFDFVNGFNKFWRGMAMTLAAGALWSGVTVTPASAQDLITRKQVFELPTFTTVSGRTLKQVKVGYETYGTLNAERSNAILICHFFSANSHAAGKYAPGDAAPGYWDAIVGPGKAIDTNKYFVISSDTLVNLNTGDPNTTTTGPASIDPDTGKPYGMTFPVVGMGDFVNVQKALVESLGIGKLHMVAGASMGALQTFEWASRYPDMMTRIMPVIGAGEADAYLIGWLDVWAAPIRLDANWNGGDYYGKTPPNAGLAQALKIVTLQANHWEWANATFGRKWAKEGADPAAGFDNRYAVEATLDSAGAARAKVSDANHFLYLVKANQIFAAAGGIAEAARKIKVPVLYITQPEDLVFQPDGVKSTAAALKAAGLSLEEVHLQGSRGHLDGVLSMAQAAARISDFVGK